MFGQVCSLHPRAGALLDVGCSPGVCRAKQTEPQALPCAWEARLVPAFLRCSFLAHVSAAALSAQFSLCFTPVFPVSRRPSPAETPFRTAWLSSARCEQEDLTHCLNKT